MKLLEVNDKYKIFCDLDGVMADFSKGIRDQLGLPHNEDTYERDAKYRKEMWKKIEEYKKKGGELWYNLELLPDAMTLWNFIKSKNPTFLTATGISFAENTKFQKKRWIKKHFGNVPSIMVNAAKEKSKHAKENYILIDDKDKAVSPWKKEGGIGILHTSAANTVNELKKLGL